MSGETARKSVGQAAPSLRRDAIGLREVLFQSITAMAPAAAVAASIPSGAAFAGGSLPLSVLIALVAFLLTASCVAELARELPAAGSVSTYVAQGLHPVVGFLSAGAMWRRHPERIAETARVHFDEPSPTGLPQNGAVQR